MADISHPPMDQLQDLEYCIDSNPPWAETILLAFQNYILMLGTSVMIPSMLVPAMGGTNGDKIRVIQTLLFVSGINTLLQALFGTRLPTVVGGSFAYVIPIIYIINDSSLQQIPEPHERFIQTMRAIQGALIVASSLQIILGYSQLWGIFSRFFSPLGIAPVIGLVGLGLFERGFPVVGNCVEIGIPALLMVIGFSQFLKHVRPVRDIPIFERFPILICVTIIWAYSHVLTAGGAYRNSRPITQGNCRTDRAYLISSAPWFKFPYPLQWGAPTFDAGHTFAMMAAVLVSLIESTGAYKAASRLAIATPPPAYVLSRGIGWQVSWRNTNSALSSLLFGSRWLFEASSGIPTELLSCSNHSVTSRRKEKYGPLCMPALNRFYPVDIKKRYLTGFSAMILLPDVKTTCLKSGILPIPQAVLHGLLHACQHRYCQCGLNHA